MKSILKDPYFRAYEQRALLQECARSDMTGAPLRIHLTGPGLRKARKKRSTLFLCLVAPSILIILFILFLLTFGGL
jgi:hypothetical protein